MDANLSGLIIGLTLTTRPEEIYRALIEATAFGTLAIIENHTDQGVPVKELYASGGLAEKNDLLLQIYADVTGRSLRVAASTQAAALGAAIAGSVAAGKVNGGYDTFKAATAKMAHLKDKTFTPDPKNQKIYNMLYREYKSLYDAFGRGTFNIMKNLRKIRDEASLGK